jgi:hypothetical protein
MNNGRPIPLRLDADELVRRDRLSLHRALAGAVLGKLADQPPEKIVRRAWPDDTKASWLTRAPVSPMDTTGTSALTATRVSDLLLIAPGSAAAQLFDRCLRLNFDGVLQYLVPHVATHPLPLFIPEGGIIPTVQAATASTTVGPVRKLAFIVGLTRELENATPEGAAIILGRLLAESAAKGLDAAVFDNNAASTSRPAGLLYGVTPLVSTAAGSGLDAAATDVAKLAGAFADAGINPQNMILATHPMQAWQLMMLRAFPDLPLPVLQSPAIPKATVIAVVPEAITSGFDGVPETEVVRQPDIVLNLDDTSPQPPGTTGRTISTFQQDMLVVKLRTKCTWSSLQPGAVQFLQSVNW